MAAAKGDDARHVRRDADAQTLKVLGPNTFRAKVGDHLPPVHDSLAMGAMHTQQAPRQGHADRVGDQERINFHIHQAADNTDSIIGVNGGEHEMARERRLHRHLRRNFVAALTDHDHVRILAQHGAETAGECEANIFIDLSLVNAFEALLNWVFDGHNIPPNPVNTSEAGVECCGFAGTCWPAQQNQAVRRADFVWEGAHLAASQADVLDARAQRAFIQQPENHLFAVDGWQ
jgi:hypothetical protein